MLRIVERFVQLRGANDYTTPLAVYQADDLVTTKLLTSMDIEKELQRWSAHSLRVGACVILHSMGYSPT